MPDLSFQEDPAPNSVPPTSSPEAPHASHHGILPEGTAEVSSALSELLAAAHHRLLSLPPEDRAAFPVNASRNDPPTIAALTRLLTQERASRKTKSSLLMGIGILPGLGALLSAIWPFYFSVAPSLYFTLIPVILGCCMTLMLLITLGRHYPASRLENAALDYLRLSAAPAHVPILLLQRPLATSAGRLRVEETLSKLLPQITPADWQQMPVAQQDLLLDVLRTKFRFQPNLSLAVMEAISRLGDTRALEPLYRLAAARAASPQQHAVRSAAQACLQTLQARLDFGPPDSIPNHLSNIFAFGNHPDVQLSIDAPDLYALLALLPQLTSENYYRLLSPTDRKLLYDLFAPALTGNYDYDHLRLYRAIVRTLERAGDTDAIPTLGMLATMGAPFEGARQLRIAAQTALHTLQQQVEKENVRKTLLRAADHPAVPSHELLRPVAPGTSETSPQEMLRISTPP